MTQIEEIAKTLAKNTQRQKILQSAKNDITIVIILLYIQGASGLNGDF